MISIRINASCFAARPAWRSAPATLRKSQTIIPALTHLREIDRTLERLSDGAIKAYVRHKLIVDISAATRADAAQGLNLAVQAAAGHYARLRLAPGSAPALLRHSRHANPAQLATLLQAIRPA